MDVKRSVIKRIITTVFLTIILMGALFIYENTRGPVEGSVAVAQLEDSDSGYIVSRSIANGLVGKTILVIYGASILLVWGTFIVNYSNKKKETE